MSTSVYPVVGRVRPDFQGQLELTTIMPNGEHIKSPLPPPGEPSPPDIQQVVQDPPAFLGVKEPEPADFIFSYPDNGYQPEHPQNVLTHMYDNYPLFSWLCNIRGDTRPRGDYVLRQARTTAFIDWIGNTPGVTYVDFAPHRQKHYKDTLREHYFDGYGNEIMFTIDELLEFNYDTVAYVEDGYDGDDPKYVPHPELKTWRELFHGKPNRVTKSDGYFEFLTEAKAKGWTFVIFCFD
ncbi:hypothetical protein FDI21_gp247 [Pseudomonas phage Noxifer]|uniref:Uncharacterized protein n=1 Tax=Pseudomonas phage Noxifer TaxID=2006684 RepID=A0A1Y0SXV7_9CAUD|nr:hypothetical protein FDI21_gp247 [Pseudomonas phage Noxifer]ARV77464.1 hypothetical protein NOXIFER_299 [Pseudomonas phage Noxifer]